MAKRPDSTSEWLRLRRVAWINPQVAKGACSWLGFDFIKVPHYGDAPFGLPPSRVGDVSAIA